MMRRLNTSIIDWTAGGLATPACVWLFLALALLPAAWPASMNVVQFISSGVLQLVALPVLAVAGAIVERRMTRRADEQHAATMKLLAEVHQMHREIHQKPKG